ncbi:hypothetical protein [Streptomyces albidoflavus]|uniref:hypothetical protein n=1 Tax=Streptomyces albidoflavus TaxID=1886 RepID=UPI0013EEC3C2|nr:hypothetical protein [Streptomyces albidoflavus]
METYLLSTDLDVRDGQSVDRRWPVCVEKEKQSCEAVVGPEGFVVQEPACDAPRVFVIEWLGGGVPADSGDVDAHAADPLSFQRLVDAYDSAAAGAAGAAGAGRPDDPAMLASCSRSISLRIARWGAR